jgi:hypothetical protein
MILVLNLCFAAASEIIGLWKLWGLTLSGNRVSLQNYDYKSEMLLVQNRIWDVASCGISAQCKRHVQLPCSAPAQPNLETERNLKWTAELRCRERPKMQVKNSMAICALVGGFEWVWVGSRSLCKSISSSFNIMIRSSPACSRKKKDSGAAG